MGPGFDVGIGGGPGIPPRFPGGGGMGRDIRDPGMDRSRDLTRLERRKTKEMAMEDRRRRMNDRRREKRERIEKDRREFEKRRPRGPGRSKPPERRPIEGRKPPWMGEKPPFFEGPLPGPGWGPKPPGRRPIEGGDKPFPGKPRWGINPPPTEKPRWGINPPPQDEPRWGLFPIPGRGRPGINPPRFDVGLPGPPGFYDRQRREENTKWKLREESDRQSLKGDDIGPKFLEKNLSKYAQFLNILKGIKGGR